MVRRCSALPDLSLISAQVAVELVPLLLGDCHLDGEVARSYCLEVPLLVVIARSHVEVVDDHKEQQTAHTSEGGHKQTLLALVVDGGLILRAAVLHVDSGLGGARDRLLRITPLNIHAKVLLTGSGGRIIDNVVIDRETAAGLACTEQVEISCQFVLI